MINKHSFSQPSCGQNMQTFQQSWKQNIEFLKSLNCATPIKISNPESQSVNSQSLMNVNNNMTPLQHQQVIANQWMPSNQTRDVLKCPDTCFLTSGAVLMLSLTLQRSTLSITCSPLWLRGSNRSLSPTYWITTVPANTDSLSCSCL